MSGNSTATRTPRKVQLTQRADGRWCKKYRGRQWYAPKGSTKSEAVKLFRAEWDDFVRETDKRLDKTIPQKQELILRVLRDALPSDYLELVELRETDDRLDNTTPQRQELTLFALRDAYLADYLELVELRESGERHTRKGRSRFTYVAARRTLSQFCECVGDKLASDIGPDDFRKFARVAVDPYAANTGRKVVAQVRAMFRWATENHKLDRLPIYGTRFEKPEAEPKQNGELKRLLFSRDELHRLLAGSDHRMKAMLLLGLNCSYGANDIAQLRVEDIDGEWLRTPRVKTGVDRDSWLWPETREAVAEYLKHDRPGASGDDRIFVTKWGRPMVRIADTEKMAPANAVKSLFETLMDSCDCRVKGRGWHSLRRVFRTIAGLQLDEVAARRVTGHKSKNPMDDIYQHVSDDRIRAVCQHVRLWLWPDAK